MRSAFFYLVLLITVAFASCDKNEDIANPFVMSASIDKTPWVSISLTNSFNPAGSTNLYIYGTSVTGHQIVLNLFNYSAAPGSYYLGGSTPTGAAYYYENNTQNTKAFKGQVNITNAADGILTGTFTFETTDSLHIDSGKFNIRIHP